MENPNKIKFKYIFDKDYNPAYINGAFGGLSPRGEIIVHFYLERSGLPISASYEFTDGKLSGELFEVKPDDHSSSMVRFIQNGIVMDYESARGIHKWLGDHIQKLEELTKIKSDE
jgi:hypothetical protein